VAALLFAFLLLVGIAFVGGRPRRGRSESVDVTGLGKGPVQAT